MKKIVVIELGGTISSYTSKSSAEFYNQQGDSIASFMDDLFCKEEIEIKYELFCNKMSYDSNIYNLFYT